MGKIIELTASDGHKLDAYRADPTGTPKGALVIIQEIFGINQHIRKVCSETSSAARISARRGGLIGEVLLLCFPRHRRRRVKKRADRFANARDDGEKSSAPAKRGQNKPQKKCLSAANRLTFTGGG